MSSGSLAGFPVVDVTAVLYDGSFHDVDSSVLAFQIAARAAFREGMRKGQVRLLEPIMKVLLCSHLPGFICAEICPSFFHLHLKQVVVPSVSTCSLLCAVFVVKNVCSTSTSALPRGSC